MNDEEQRELADLFLELVQEIKLIRKLKYVLVKNEFKESKSAGIKYWIELVNIDLKRRISFALRYKRKCITIQIYRPKLKRHISGSYTSLSFNDYIELYSPEYAYCLKLNKQNESTRDQLKACIVCLEDLFEKDEKLASVIAGLDWVNIMPEWMKYK